MDRFTILASFLLVSLCGIVCSEDELGPWSNWTDCTQTCGYGVQMKHRACPPQQNCPLSHIGELRRCKILECPIDGGWSSWSRWRPDRHTCGEDGSYLRNRRCNNPRPQYGGVDCTGHSSESRPRRLNPCPVDGEWGEWSTWSPCSARSCRRRGQRTRTRICVFPLPAYRGANCQGTSYETEDCKRDNCPVHGGWSAWSNWSACPDSPPCPPLELNVRIRTRQCDNPTPRGNRAKACPGDDTEETHCPGCPPDGVVVMSSSFESEEVQTPEPPESYSYSSIVEITGPTEDPDSSIVVFSSDTADPDPGPDPGPDLGPGPAVPEGMSQSSMEDIVANPDPAVAEGMSQSSMEDIVANPDPDCGPADSSNEGSNWNCDEEGDVGGGVVDAGPATNAPDEDNDESWNGSSLP